MKPRRVLLGSMSVTYETWLPYAAGCLQSYAQQDPEIQSKFVFAEPLYKDSPDLITDDLLASVDILGLTCYVWNQGVNDHLIRRYKNLNSTGLVIFGGPNIPKDLDQQKAMALSRPDVDLFFVGPGEAIFTQFLKNIDQKPRNAHPGTFGLWAQEFFSLQTEVKRQIEGDDLPDPYNAKIFAPALLRESRVKCSFETNRGCPFKCAFCDWGGTSNSRVSKFSDAKVRGILDYIYAQSNVAELEILDANFGMQSRDLQTVEYMVALKDKNGRSPKVSYSGLVKNGSAYLAPILRLIHNHLGAEQRNLKISFQTHTEHALKVVNRENIRPQRLLPIVAELQGEGLAVTSEMIIGLPGETADSWLATLQRDYELRIDFMRAYFLHLTCNTEMYDRAYQLRHGIKTKKLKFPNAYVGLGYKNVWNRQDLALLSKGPSATTDQIYEELEIIYECDSFNLEEIVRMFDYWWFYNNFLNSRALKLVIDHLSAKGFSLRDQILHFFDWLPEKGLLAEVLQRSRRDVRILFSAEEETYIHDLSLYFFYSRCLRHDEVFRFWTAADQFFSELDGYLARWIPEAGERRQLLRLQREAWAAFKPTAQWSDVRKFFGTDARVLSS